MRSLVLRGLVVVFDAIEEDGSDVGFDCLRFGLINSENALRFWGAGIWGSVSYPFEGEVLDLGVIEEIPRVPSIVGTRGEASRGS